MLSVKSGTDMERMGMVNGKGMGKGKGIGIGKSTLGTVWSGVTVRGDGPGQDKVDGTKRIALVEPGTTLRKVRGHETAIYKRIPC